MQISAVIFYFCGVKQQFAVHSCVWPGCYRVVYKITLSYESRSVKGINYAQVLEWYTSTLEVRMP